jgi:acyl-CoA synthetase (NDP forming)
VDLVAIVIAARLIPPVLEECGKKGIKNILIISSGFQEIGSEGIRIAEEVKELLDKYEMRAIGPNCQGLVNTHNHLYAALGMESHSLAVKKGGIGIISQSGSVGIDLVQRTLDEKLGFSFWVNLGNKLDVNEADIIRYMGNDPNVSVMAGYLEDIKAGALFLETIQSLKKPLVILKSGRTKAGQRAARSHTAALAGNDKIVDGIFRQFHIYRAETTDDLFDLAKALSLLKPPLGKRLMIVESSGGIGTLASDIAEKAGLELPDLDEESKDKMRQILPPFLKPQNPVDLGTQFGSQFSKVAEARILDHYDAILILFADPILDAAEAVQAFQRNSRKPIVVAFSGGGKIQKKETAKIRRLGIPIYPNVERALKFFAKCAERGT